MRITQYLLIVGALLNGSQLWSNEGIPFGQAVADPIKQSGVTVELTKIVEMPPTSDRSPRTRINAMTTMPDGRLFVNDLRGQLYEITDGEPQLYMDYASLVPELFHENGLGSGLGSVAFHPEFSANGKFYTTHVEVADSPQGNGSTRGFSRGWTAGIVSEWTAKNPDADRFEGTRRELLRVPLPTDVHGMQHVAFNPNSKKGEPDFGMLYISLGEGGAMQMGRNEFLRNLNSLLGCILRIDPLGTGSKVGGYGIPDDNPWADSDDPNVLGEIWAMGMRNPHRISWDTGGSGRMFFGDIGEMRIEEINIGEPGRDYGWPIREGGYRFDSMTRHLVYDLSEEERRNEPDLTYPVAQYDHTEGYAISGGGVYRGETLPDLYGKYVFGDIVSGRLFYVDESELEFGSMGQVMEFNISVDGELSSFARMIGGGRVDLRLGWDADGELYIFEKGRGVIFKAISSTQVNENQGAGLRGIDRQLIEHAVKVDPDHAIVASGRSPMIDDMEDGDLDLLPSENRVGSWGGFSMGSNGAQPIQVIELEEAPGEGSHVLQISGSPSGRESPRVVLSFNGELGAGNSLYYDASAYDGIQLWVKGIQSARMTCRIATPYTLPISEGGLCDGESYSCGNEYEFRINIEDDWSLVRLPFAQFLQDDLPHDGPLDPSILKTVGFSLRARSEFTILLDDLSFYKDS